MNFLYIKRFLKFILTDPIYRKVLIIFIDIFILNISFYFLKIIFGNISSYSLLDFNSRINFSIYSLLGTLIFIFSYLFTGQYKSLTRYLGSITLYFIVLRNLIIISILYLLSILYFGIYIPIIYPFILWLVISSISSGVRFIYRDLLIVLRQNSKSRKRVAIYGAGAAGIQLSNSLKTSNDYQIIFFIDDSKLLIGNNINGIPIFKSEKIKKFKSKIDQILLAIPSLNHENKLKIIKSIQKVQIPALEIPSIEELAQGNKSIDMLKPIPIQDLMPRKSVEPLDEFLKPSITLKNILITGAGGSIGSELCREIIKLSPKSLLIIDNSEENLYLIDHEIRNKVSAKDNIEIKSFLGDVCDQNFLWNIFVKYKINTVFHAAAYKHVPLVESNPISGIANNYKSTWNLAKFSKEFGIEKFTLISSDKAVRPTNVMGASKRLSELIIQAFASEETKKANNNIPKTVFSMVRFGNVLGSSGSVVKLFTKQIKNGGPITLTNPKMIRYFMTVKEAAQLVIQSSSLSKGGDLFLLDMGEPVKIKSLALQMIYLSGLALKNEKNEDGDIEIVNIGLRPGEKLYEELLIDAKSIKTKHPLIYRAIEDYIHPDTLWKELNSLDEFINKYDVVNVLRKLSELVKEWNKKNYD